MVAIIPNTASLIEPMEIKIRASEILDSPDFCYPRAVKHVKSYELTAEYADFLYVENISRFSGFSGLTFSEDGDLLILSDRAYYVDAREIFDRDANIECSSALSTIGTLKGKGREVLNYTGNDVEDIELYQGDCFISHEIVNSISRYGGCDFESKPQELTVPSNISRFARNLGMESLGISKDGVFISMEEYNSNHFSEHSAFLWKYTDESYDIIENEIGFTYKSNSGYSVSGISFTCEGNLLLLEREIVADLRHGGDTSKYSLAFQTRVKFVPRSVFEGIEQGDTISGTEILYIHNNGSKLSISDNFEGIATRCENENKTSIYLISDDNQSPEQRNLLLQFEMNEKSIVEDLTTYGKYHDDTNLSGCVEGIYPFCSDK